MRELSLAGPLPLGAVIGHAAREAVEAAAAGRLPEVVLIRGAGGTGKTWLLERLVDALRASGQAVVGPGQEPRSARGPFTVVADDVHRIGQEEADRLLAAAGHPMSRLLLAGRPAPSSAAWLSLSDALPMHRSIVRRSHLDTTELADWLRAVGRDTGAAVELLAETGGLPVVVGAALAATRYRQGPGRPPGQDWADAALDALPPTAAAVLGAVAAGAPWDEDLLAEALLLPRPEVTAAVDVLWASGLVHPDGTVLPGAGAGLPVVLGAPRSQTVQRRVLAALARQGRAPVALARAVASGSAPDPLAAQILVTQAASAVHEDPAGALRLLDDAVAAGASADEMTTTRTVAAVLDGRLDLALALHPGPGKWEPEHVALLAAEGRYAEAAAHAGSRGPAALARVMAGQDLSPVLPSGTGEMDAEAETAAAVRGTLGPKPDDAATDAATESALDALVRAQSVAPGGRTATGVDSPASVGAVLALHVGDHRTARHLLHRALTADTGGPLLRPRHLLMTGWVALAGGDLPAAAQHLAQAEVPEGTSRRLAAREELLAAALAVALAHHSQDSAALDARWDRARSALRAGPMDLTGLLPVAALRVAGGRAGRARDVGAAVRAADDLLDRLGQPPVWALPWHWAAVVSGPPDAASTTALSDLASRSTRGALLAAAAGVWRGVTQGVTDSTAVHATCDQLLAAGLHDAARDVADHAARHLPPGPGRATVLRRARGSTDRRHPAAQPAGRPEGAPPARLTARERQVAKLLVAGQTHAEIGGRLFLSPRTVEHHVGLIRRRLGADGRADLLRRLRWELQEP